MVYILKTFEFLMVILLVALTMMWFLDVVKFVVDSINDVQIRIHKPDMPHQIRELGPHLSVCVALLWIIFILNYLP